MSEGRRPWTCLEFVHQCKRQKQRYIVSYRLVACCGYSAVTTDRVTGRAELSAAVRFPASLKGISSGSRGDGIVKWEIQGCDLYSKDVSKCCNWLAVQHSEMCLERNASLTWHFKSYEMNPQLSPHRHLGGRSPAPCVDSTGRPHSIKIQLLLPTWQALTFCRGSRRAAGDRLKTQWCFFLWRMKPPVPLCCHSSSLPPRLILLFILYASVSFRSPSSLSATMHASST